MPPPENLLDHVRQSAPHDAADALEAAADAEAAVVLQELNPMVAQQVLHQMTAERRCAILAAAPIEKAHQWVQNTGYPEDSVGALADTTIVTLLPASPVREVLARLKTAHDDVGDFLYVVDDERFLRACLRPAALLHVTGTMSVGALDPVRVPRLAAQASPRSVRDHPGWNHYSTLPVVDRDGRLIGALRQSVLRQALDRAPATPATRTEPGTLAALGDVLWSAAATLLQSAVGALPASRRGSP